MNRKIIGFKNGLLVVLLLAGFLAPAGTTLAHHGVAAYDYGKTVVTKVTVTHFDWINPHCKIYFDVTHEKRNVEHWVVELHPPGELMDHGWTRQSLSPGDVVTLYFRPAKDGSASGLLSKAVLPNGLELQQNVLLLPAGETFTMPQWERRRPKS